MHWKTTKSRDQNDQLFWPRDFNEFWKRLIKRLCAFWIPSRAVTLDFSSLLKNHFVSSECSLQSSECSLQSSNVCFEVRSEYLRWLNSEQFDWLTYYGSQSELAKLAHRKLSERTSKQTLELCNEHSELCNEHSELTNEHSKWFFKSELKSRVTLYWFR